MGRSPPPPRRRRQHWSRPIPGEVPGVARQRMKRASSSIVLPAHNEQENVAAIHAEIRKYLPGAEVEIVFVDDGSTDATAARVRELRARDPWSDSSASAAISGSRRRCSPDCRRRAARPSSPWTATCSIPPNTCRAWSRNGERRENRPHGPARYGGASGFKKLTRACSTESCRSSAKRPSPKMPPTISCSTADRRSAAEVRRPPAVSARHGELARLPGAADRIRRGRPPRGNAGLQLAQDDSLVARRGDQPVVQAPAHGALFGLSPRRRWRWSIWRSC